MPLSALMQAVAVAVSATSTGSAALMDASADPTIICPRPTAALRAPQDHHSSKCPYRRCGPSDRTPRRSSRLPKIQRQPMARCRMANSRLAELPVNEIFAACNSQVVVTMRCTAHGFDSLAVRRRLLKHLAQT